MALDISAKKVYGALKKDVSAIDTKVDNAILSMYKAGGSLEFDNLPSPSSDVANMAYLVTDAFTTTSDFVEGAGVDYPAGTYVSIVNTGTEDDPDYKYDVVPFTMVVDDTMSAVSENPLQNKVITGAVQEIRLDISNLSASKISKSETVGHVMNDGSIDENEYIDKVENAVAGDIAVLTSDGNLTDSGVSPTEDVTVEGNPATFESPFEQDAKSVVVSVKPIQDLHGYDHPWVGGTGKNKCESYVATASTEQYVIALYIETDLQASTTYAISFDDIAGNNFYANENVFTGDIAITTVNGRNSIVVTTKDNLAKDQTTYENGKGWIILKNQFAQSVTPDISKVQIEIGSSATSYESYSNICPISGIDELEIGVSDGESAPTTTTLTLPSTLYDADIDVTNGTGTDNKGFVEFDGSSDENWSKESGYNLFVISVPELPSVSGWGYPIPNWLTNIGIIFAENTDSGAENHTISYGANYLYVKSNIATVEDFKTWLTNNPIQVLYPLATPTTISLTPTDVELLEGTNVVATNGEKVAVTYGRSLWQDINALKTDTEGKLDKSDVADIEGDTASKAYSVNDFMLRSDGLYKVTAPIAQNASITASNTTKTTIGAVLTALLNG